MPLRAFLFRSLLDELLTRRPSADLPPPRARDHHGTTGCLPGSTENPLLPLDPEALRSPQWANGSLSPPDRIPNEGEHPVPAPVAPHPFLGVAACRRLPPSGAHGSLAACSRDGQDAPAPVRANALVHPDACTNANNHCYANATLQALCWVFMHLPSVDCGHAVDHAENVHTGTAS